MLILARSPVEPATSIRLIRRHYPVLTLGTRVRPGQDRAPNPLRRFLASGLSSLTESAAEPDTRQTRHVLVVTDPGKSVRATPNTEACSRASRCPRTELLLDITRCFMWITKTGAKRCIPVPIGERDKRRFGWRWCRGPVNVSARVGVPAPSRDQEKCSPGRVRSSDCSPPFVRASACACSLTRSPTRCPGRARWTQANGNTQRVALAPFHPSRVTQSSGFFGSSVSTGTGAIRTLTPVRGSARIGRPRTRPSSSERTRRRRLSKLGADVKQCHCPRTVTDWVWRTHSYPNRPERGANEAVVRSWGLLAALRNLYRKPGSRSLRWQLTPASRGGRAPVGSIQDPASRMTSIPLCRPSSQPASQP